MFLPNAELSTRTWTHVTCYTVYCLSIVLWQLSFFQGYLPVFHQSTPLTLNVVVRRWAGCILLQSAVLIQSGCLEVSAGRGDSDTCWTHITVHSCLYAVVRRWAGCIIIITHASSSHILYHFAGDRGDRHHHAEGPSSGDPRAQIPGAQKFRPLDLRPAVPQQEEPSVL